MCWRQPDRCEAIAFLLVADIRDRALPMLIQFDLRQMFHIPPPLMLGTLEPLVDVLAVIERRSSVVTLRRKTQYPMFRHLTNYLPIPRCSGFGKFRAPAVLPTGRRFLFQPAISSTLTRSSMVEARRHSDKTPVQIVTD